MSRQGGRLFLVAPYTGSKGFLMPTQPILEEPNVTEIREAWLRRLEDLVQTVRDWATEMGWSTRRIEKSMKDSVIGRYVAPALILQEETTRILLEPIARSAPGAEGVVDLYLMPAYDDIASLYLSNGVWQLHYMWPGTPTVNTMREAEPEPFSREILQRVLHEMKNNATIDE